jgi:aryl-alcohol dehydrogenase-like predicted oxidoreductase
MRYKPLGLTGLKVSEITLGTVEFGMNYGFRGTGNYERPSVQESIRTIHSALDRGINLIDTARAYGTAEEILGDALSQAASKPYVASKVSIPIEALAAGDLEAVRTAVASSVEASLKALRLDAIDVLQIHNTCPEILKSHETLGFLAELQKQGKIRYLGASSYGEETPLQAVETGIFQTIQVPFNMLDQTMTQRVFKAAACGNSSILVRSAFLRGVLTPQVHDLPARLAPLKTAALRALDAARDEVEDLAEAALRFCLSFREVTTVIIGVRSAAEMEVNIAAAAKGPLGQATMDRLSRLGIDDERLINPQYWSDIT